MYLVSFSPMAMAAAFKIIKALLPPKAVAALRFVNAKNLSDYMTKDNMLASWGGSDDYEYSFVPETRPAGAAQHEPSNNNDMAPTTDENDNTIVPVKKVRTRTFAIPRILCALERRPNARRTRRP